MGERARVDDDPGDAGGVLESYFGAIHHSYHQIFFGNIVNAALTGIIGAIAYNTIDLFAPPGLALPYPTLIGLLAGVASLIPIVGMKLVYFPATAYLAGAALVAGEPRLLWFPVAFAAVSFVIVDVIPDLVLRPYVSGGGFEFSGRLSRRLHLDAIFRSGGQSPTPGMHVGAVMLAYVFGPLLFGWYGIFLGPMLLVLVVHFARIVLPELVVGQPIQPYAVDPTHLTEPADPEVETPSTGPDDAVGGE